MKRIALLSFSLLLLGAGCTAELPGDKNTTALPSESAIVGVDGSLTQLTFDQLGEAFREHLLQEEDIDASLEVRFETWLATQEDTYPQEDTFLHPIQLESYPEAPDWFYLRSAGADGKTQTADDYVKRYLLPSSYEEVSTDTDA